MPTLKASAKATARGCASGAPFGLKGQKLRPEFLCNARIGGQEDCELTQSCGRSRPLEFAFTGSHFVCRSLSAPVQVSRLCGYSTPGTKSPSWLRFALSALIAPHPTQPPVPPLFRLSRPSLLRSATTVPAVAASLRCRLQWLDALKPPFEGAPNLRLCSYTAAASSSSSISAYKEVQQETTHSPDLREMPQETSRSPD